MKHLAPAIFNDFLCAAGSCPDSCCRAGWEIVIDPETLGRYDALSGQEAARIRQAILPGQEALLRQDDRRVCLLLDPDGLCCVQRHHGHGFLCRVCREYPRFHREFGNLTEHGLSLSCPTVFAMAVAEPPRWAEWEDDGPVVPNDLDPGRYLLLRKGRELALDFLTREDYSFEERCALILSLATRLQRGLDGETRVGDAALRRLASPIGRKAVLRRFYDGTRFRADRWFRPQRVLRWAQVFAGLEILSPEWRDGLEALQQRLREADGRVCRMYEEWPSLQSRGAVRDPELYARYLWYSLYKYWLDAADDGRLLPRVRRSLTMTLLGLAMDHAVPKDRSWLQRISREIEHCEENLCALLGRL